MEAKFTPGPWRLQYYATQDGKGGTKENWVIGVDDNYISRLSAWTPEQEANANLIAAAPELLEAVEHVLIASEDNGNMDDIDWNMLRAAIAKARGEA